MIKRILFILSTILLILTLCYFLVSPDKMFNNITGIQNKDDKEFSAYIDDDNIIIKTNNENLPHPSNVKVKIFFTKFVNDHILVKDISYYNVIINYINEHDYMISNIQNSLCLNLTITDNDCGDIRIDSVFVTLIINDKHYITNVENLELLNNSI